MTRDELVEKMALAWIGELWGTPIAKAAPKELAAARSALAAIESVIPVGRILSGEDVVVPIGDLEMAAQATAIVMRSK